MHELLHEGKNTTSNLCFLWCWIIENIIHSCHFNDNSAIAEGVSNCSEPGSEVAEYCSRCSIIYWENEQVEVEVENDGSTAQ